jgi:uncharacterized membrane protein
MEESKNTISIIFEIVRFLSVASMGIFVGSMLTEGCIFLPYWRSLSSADFFEWYASNGQRLQDFFGPLTTITTLFAIAAAIVSLWESNPNKWFALLAAVISVAIVSTFFVYFKNANASFSAANLRVDELAKELTRWSIWHWTRTGMSVVAFALSLICLWKP